MSPSLRRFSLTGVASILACAPILAGLGACYRTSAPVHDPSLAGPATVGNGHQSNDDLRPRHFPGVDAIRMPRGGFFVRIHSGLVGAGEPLYVIDGSPVTVDRSRGIDWVKLEDVVEIRVLKDPSETTVYGTRGVNGVVVITTKQAANQRRRGR